MSTNKVVSSSEWRAARLALLEKEKEITRAADAAAAQRRTLPMVEMSKSYTFTGLDASGKEVTLPLSDLFAGRRQLIVYHFMYDPSWDAGCTSCSLTGDGLGGMLEHVNSRDTTICCVSRAPIAKIAAYKQRMGWTFPWYSSYGSDFNYDFHVTQDESVHPVECNYKNKAEMEARGLQYAAEGEQPGVSCFVKGGGELGIGQEGKVYHTYSAYARGVERLTGFATLLDLTVLGRQDEPQKMPVTVRRDEYTPEMLRGTA